MGRSIRAARGPTIVLAASLALLSCAATAHEEAVGTARASSAEGDWPRAARLWYGLWLESDMRDGEAAREAARALASDGQTESALGVLSARLARAPGDPAALAAAGSLEAQLGRLEAARATLERARELAPDDGQVAVDLARVELALGDAEGARAHLAPLAGGGTDGTSRAATLELARTAAALGRTGEALDAFAAAFAAGDASTDDALTAARLALAAGTPESPPDARPLEWLARAEARDPLRTDVPRAAAELALARGDAARAARDARRALAADPGDVRAVELLVRALRAEGQPAEAARILAHGRSLELDDAERALLDALDAPPPDASPPAAPASPGEEPLEQASSR